MFRRIAAKLSALIGILFFANVGFAEDFFTVVFDVAHDGKIFASQTVVTSDGSRAFVEMNNPEKIKLSFVVLGMPNRQVKIMTTIDTARKSSAPGFVTLEEQPVEFQLDDVRARIIVYRNKI